MKKLFLQYGRLIWSVIARPLSRGGISALIICTCFAFVGTEAGEAWREYQANIKQVRLMTTNSAQTVAYQVESALWMVDTVVGNLVERIESDGTDGDARMHLYHRLSSLTAAFPAIHELVIADSRGKAIMKSLAPDPGGINVADQEYFRFHAANPDRASLIGGRTQVKADGVYHITVTRRINQADGSFGGVVVASVSLVYLQRQFDQLRARTGFVVALFADNGEILARSPALAGDALASPLGGALGSEIQREPIAASLAYTSPIDGVERYGSYRRLDLYPLRVLVSENEKDMLRSWRSELRWRVIIVVGTVIVMMILGSRAMLADRVLKTQAGQDGLTGLATRRVFDETIEREFRRAARCHQPVSIIMIDIDNFKSYNDRYGHPAGDECLRAIAWAIRGNLRREGDVAARYGGEEIAVILPGSDVSRAYALAARMRLAVRGLEWRHAGSAYGIVTISAGTAGCVPARNSIDWQALVHMADKALYEAKASGRDAVKSSAREVLEAA